MKAEVVSGIRAVVFDRDGTLIEHVPYVSEPGQIRLLDGVAAGLQTLRERGLVLFVHTNQSGIARGMFDLEAVERCNERMIELIGQGGEVFEEICIAPEHPEDPPRYRKPSPRFAREICDRLTLPASALCYIGDRASDLQTAAAAGSQGVGVRTGRGNLDEELSEAGLAGKYPVCDDFSEVLNHLLPQIDDQ